MIGFAFCRKSLHNSKFSKTKLLIIRYLNRYRNQSLFRFNDIDLSVKFADGPCRAGVPLLHMSRTGKGCHFFYKVKTICCLFVVLGCGEREAFSTS